MIDIDRNMQIDAWLLWAEDLITLLGRVNSSFAIHQASSFIGSLHYDCYFMNQALRTMQ